MMYYYKTQALCDGVEITFDQGYDRFEEVIGSPISLTIPVSFEFIPKTSNIEVFDSSGTIVPSSKYTESCVGSPLTCQITVDADVSRPVTIVRKPGRLVDGVHYERINSQIIKFDQTNSQVVDLIENGYINRVYTYNPAKEQLNPAKVIDTDSETVIATVPLWDPARGHFYHNAIHVVDIQRGSPLTADDSDPALYTQTVDGNKLSTDAPWSIKEVGTVWFDASKLGYVPYYDDKIFSTLEERGTKWGELAPWADINLYQWTESDVPPEQYSSIAAEQQGDITIDERVRVTGTPKSTPYKRTRDNFEFSVTTETQGKATVHLDDSYGITNASDLTGLVNNFSEQFTAPGGSPAPLTFQFTLSQSYVPNQGLLTVTVDGIPTTNVTEDSTTQFTVSGLQGGEAVLATIVAPTYNSYVIVDGTTHKISVRGSSVQNFGQLINRINDDIENATAVLDGNNIIITSDSTGSTSTIEIKDEGIGSPLTPNGLRLFQNLTNIKTVGSPLNISITEVAGLDSAVTVTNHSFEDGDEVIVSSSGTLPSPLEQQTYTVVASGSPIGNIFQLKDSSGTIVGFDDTGEGTHTIASALFSNWSKEIDVHEVVDVTTDNDSTPGAIPITNFEVGDVVSVYVNETFIEELTVEQVGSPPQNRVVFTSYTTNPQDIIRVIKFAHIITDADEQFNPDVQDDGTIHVQYKNFYDYTEVKSIAENGVDTVTKYYFWVGDKTTRTLTNSSLSLRQAQEGLKDIPIPYMIPQNLKSETPATDTRQRMPARYSQVVVRGLAGLVDKNDRYVLRFTRDNTLRDSLYGNPESPQYKNVHTEWELFREKQQYHPRRDLWDRITESMVGYKLSDPTTRVPARERELYDELYQTDTQYGLQPDQIFVDGDIAKTTILADLQNPDNDFYPVDINAFFEQFSFDTNEDIIASMNRIYNTFNYEHVNRILHSVLLDAMSKKSKYSNLFKTSMISLHGIKIFETAGIYDD